jgi:hypothetical protein
MAPFIYRAQTSGGGRQVLVSTHSDEMLSDEGISPEEILLVQPASEGSNVVVGASVTKIAKLMKLGVTANEAVLPRTKTDQMDLFADMEI